jgi:hypothetical protein
VSLCVLVSLWLELPESAGAVPLLILMNVVHVEDAEQEVPCRHGLSVKVNVPAGFELVVDAADEKVRNIVVLMLI